MSMESLFGILDVFWVGRLGSDAVAIVGVTEALLTVVFAVALGLSLSTTATVARRVGEKDTESAAITAVQAILLGVAVAVPTGVMGLVWPRELLRFMGMGPAVVEKNWTYTAWMLGGNATILLLFLINAIFRGAGDASIAMRSLWLANAVNIVLDPCLIFGLGPFPEMGIAGAAMGTTFGRAAGVLYQMRALSRGGRVAIERRHLRVDGAVIVRLLRVSLGGIVQFLIATASWLGLVRILTPFGAASLAGYTIAIRIIVVFILPFLGAVQRRGHPRRPEPRGRASRSGRSARSGSPAPTTWASWRSWA
jgi:putative MATE family efflux protein